MWLTVLPLCLALQRQTCCAHPIEHQLEPESLGSNSKGTIAAGVTLSAAVLLRAPSREQHMQAAISNEFPLFARAGVVSAMECLRRLRLARPHPYTVRSDAGWTPLSLDRRHRATRPCEHCAPDKTFSFHLGRNPLDGLLGLNRSDATSATPVGTGCKICKRPASASATDRANHKRLPSSSDASTNSASTLRCLRFVVSVE